MQFLSYFSLFITHQNVTNNPQGPCLKKKKANATTTTKKHLNMIDSRTI
jgi:hypothetical protein